MFNCSIETQLGKHLKKINEDHKHVECVTYIYGQDGQPSKVGAMEEVFIGFQDYYFRDE